MSVEMSDVIVGRPGFTRDIVTIALSEYDVVATTTTGSCFYDCVALHTGSGQLFTRLERSWEVRQRMTDYVLDHWARLGSCSYDSEGNVFVTPSEYECAMRRPTTFACHAEVQAAAELYDLTIIVFSPSGVRISTVNDGRENVMRVVFTGEHGHYEYLLLSRPSAAAVVRGSEGPHIPRRMYWVVLCSNRIAEIKFKQLFYIDMFTSPH